MLTKNYPELIYDYRGYEVHFLLTDREVKDEFDTIHYKFETFVILKNDPDQTKLCSYTFLHSNNHFVDYPRLGRVYTKFVNIPIIRHFWSRLQFSETMDQCVRRVMEEINSRIDEKIQKIQHHASYFENINVSLPKRTMSAFTNQLYNGDNRE